jgi:DNA-binding response OmpR family regulator
LLRNSGYEVMVAYDGIEGLDKLADFHPDLVLMDVGMPRMSGVGFYERILGSNGKPAYPIIVMTGRMDLELTFQSLPVAGIIMKPFLREDLLKEVSQILHQYSPLCLN